jgi:hypothetical protein
VGSFDDRVSTVFRHKFKTSCFGSNCINYGAMRHRGLGWIASGALFFQGGLVRAQSSLDALQEELKEAKQQHQDVTQQVLSNFFDQIDPAMASPDAAVALYEKAGGTPPDPSPVIKENVDETATERDTREARDQANIARLGAALQLQCGLMHFGALFVVKPNQPSLQDQWTTWLKAAAQVYPQFSVPPLKKDEPPNSQKKKKDSDDDTPAPKPPPAPPFYPADVLNTTLHDSQISKFLGFNAWADSGPGEWTVRSLTKLYRANVLEPLRANPTADTLAAWDAFIAMSNADEPDNDNWYHVDYPPLEFDRACDDYATAPSTEKLETLVNMIKANPTYPQVDDWISRVGKLMDDYRARHGGAPVTAQPPVTTPSASASDPNVTVSTVQQGDMTIVTTHTNSPPVTNTMPAH